MPFAAPTDAQLRRTRQRSHARYNAERRAVHGPDPRSTARWQRLRLVVLSEEPLCRDIYGVHQAEGRVEPTTEVDHIVGMHVNPALMWERSNLQGLCTHCHSRKSNEERRTPC